MIKKEAVTYFQKQGILSKISFRQMHMRKLKNFKCISLKLSTLMYPSESCCVRLGVCVSLFGHAELDWFHPGESLNHCIRKKKVGEGWWWKEIRARGREREREREREIQRQRTPSSK